MTFDSGKEVLASSISKLSFKLLNLIHYAALVERMKFSAFYEDLDKIKRLTYFTFAETEKQHFNKGKLFITVKSRPKPKVGNYKSLVLGLRKDGFLDEQSPLFNAILHYEAASSFELSFSFFYILYIWYKLITKTKLSTGRLL